MSLFPGPREDGLCLGLNFNISKVGYSFLLKVHAFLQVDFLEDEFQCKKNKKKNSCTFCSLLQKSISRTKR